MNIDKYIYDLQIKNNKFTNFDNLNLIKACDCVLCEKPLVSIVCNTYNHKKYIAMCLDGFLRQYVNFNIEILVHDDASTDGTSDIVEEYAEKYPNIIFPIIQKENQFSKGVKYGIKYQYSRARGKYIAFCEGDDMWIDPYKLIQEVNILEKNDDVFAVVHDVINYDCQANKISKNLYKKHKNGILKFNEICDGFAYHLSSLVYRSNYEINNAIPKDLYIFPKMGDFPKSINIYLHGKTYFINKKMSLYRYKSNAYSFTNNQVVNSDKYFVIFFENLLKYVNDKNKKYVQRKKSDFLISSYYERGLFSQVCKDKTLRAALRQSSFKMRSKFFIKKNFKIVYNIYGKINRKKHY